MNFKVLDYDKPDFGVNRRLLKYAIMSRAVC